MRIYKGKKGRLWCVMPARAEKVGAFILLCPCGGIPKFVSSKGQYYFECECGDSSDLHNSQVDAIEEWNQGLHGPEDIKGRR